MVNVFIPRESGQGETRVAATPETVRQMSKAGLTVLVEKGAGSGSHIGDEAWAGAGARLVEAPEGWSVADLVLNVGPPPFHERLEGKGGGSPKRGAVWIGFLSSLHHLKEIEALASGGITSLAMDLVPRITRAQKMDALSSQANIAGYKAVLLAACHLDKYFPLLMTAAGTVQPARVVVMGAGVAGLQAVATARRLGAVVEVSDIRPAVKEQVQSLGGRFIELPQVEGGEGRGGYAKELSTEALARQQQIISDHVAAADVVITTALVPGKAAPVLVTRGMVSRMRAGSVIVDLAASQGGNCEATRADQEVVENGVRIFGPSNLPATVPGDASLLYARNVLAVVQHLVVDGALRVDPEDEIVKAMLLTRDGEVLHGPTAERLKEATAC